MFSPPTAVRISASYTFSFVATDGITGGVGTTEIMIPHQVGPTGAEAPDNGFTDNTNPGDSTTSGMNLSVIHLIMWQVSETALHLMV